MRLFQQLMEERAQELQRGGAESFVGFHLSSIQGYVAGDAEPSLAFLQEAAAILGVRYAWLATGHGAPTDAGEAARIVAEGSVAGGVDQDVLQGFEDGLGAPLESLAPAARAALLSAWAAGLDRRQLASFSIAYGPWEKSLARMVAEAARAPLARLGVAPPLTALGPRGDAAERFIIAMCMALTHLLESLPDPFTEEDDDAEA